MSIMSLPSVCKYGSFLSIYPNMPLAPRSDAHIGRCSILPLIRESYGNWPTTSAQHAILGNYIDLLGITRCGSCSTIAIVFSPRILRMLGGLSCCAYSKRLVITSLHAQLTRSGRPCTAGQLSLLASPIWHREWNQIPASSHVH